MHHSSQNGTVAPACQEGLQGGPRCAHWHAGMHTCHAAQLASTLSHCVHAHARAWARARAHACTHTHDRQCTLPQACCMCVSPRHGATAGHVAPPTEAARVDEGVSQEFDKLVKADGL